MLVDFHYMYVRTHILFDIHFKDIKEKQQTTVSAFCCYNWYIAVLIRNFSVSSVNS